jgi:hypothetical protein
MEVVMTVKQLVATLNMLVKSGQVKAEDEVLLSSDEEGNSLSPIIPTEFWAVESLKNLREMESSGLEDVKSEKCLIIYPSR